MLIILRLIDIVIQRQNCEMRENLCRRHHSTHVQGHIFKMICCNILIQASTAAELSDGLAMSEALVQIEPAVFTPSWFAGILKSDNTNYQTLSIILNLLLHFYR